MTDQYYANEDKPVETSETAITNWTQQSSALAGFVPQAAQDLTYAENILGKIYADAQAAEDEETQGNIREIWDLFQQHTNQMAQLDAAREAAVAVIQRIDADRKKAEVAYDELNSAVENVDEDDPRIRDIIEMVEEGVYEWGDLYDGYGEGESDAWDQVGTSISNATKAPSNNVGRFVEFLMGMRPINDQQKALLITTIQAFTPEMDEVVMDADDSDEDDDE